MIVVLLGPHGAGKSTVGRALARELGWPFHEEVGWQLAQDPAYRRTDATAVDPQERFDRCVFQRELARDDVWIPGRNRVVETWHPGNLAYAERRSPAVVRHRLPEILLACAGEQTVAVPVEAPMSVLARRQHEPGDLRFFMEVGRGGVRWAQRLGIEVLAPVSTHLRSPDHLARQLKHCLAALPRTRMVGAGGRAVGPLSKGAVSRR